MNSNTTVIDRISYLLDRDRISKTELSKATGISRNTINSWFCSTRNRVDIRNENLLAIADYFHVTKTWLKTGSDVEINSTAIKAPKGLSQILTAEITIVDGKAVFNDYEDVLNPAFSSVFFEFNRTTPEHCHFVKVYSDDMHPLLMPEDMLIVDDTELSTGAIYSGRLYMIVLNDATTMFREIHKKPLSSELTLHSPNENYGDIICDSSQFAGVYRVLKIERRCK